MNSALGTVKEFVESYPWVIASFFTGIFIGLLIALPLGWELPEPGGTLFAAAVGAAAAVGGAIWAAKYKQDAEVVEHEGQREDEITEWPLPTCQPSTVSLTFYHSWESHCLAVSFTSMSKCFASTQS
jgi:hypothetical protein